MAKGEKEAVFSFFVFAGLLEIEKGETTDSYATLRPKIQRLRQPL